MLVLVQVLVWAMMPALAHVMVLALVVRHRVLLAAAAAAAGVLVLVVAGMRLVIDKVMVTTPVLVPRRGCHSREVGSEHLTPARLPTLREAWTCVLCCTHPAPLASRPQAAHGPPFHSPRRLAQRWMSR